MVKSLKVILWNEEIGRLVWSAERKTSYFMYNPEFLKRGLNVSPIVAPVNDNMIYEPVWGEDGKIYQKLPAFVADSLPDAWGNQLFDIWRQQNHLSNSDVTPLDKLSFIGKRSMGALEFIPEMPSKYKNERIDVQSLAALAGRIYEERESVRIKHDESVTMQSLLMVGTSAGGRKPKAIVAINNESGEIRSGQVSGLNGYDYYLLKFGYKPYSSAEIEMTYYEMAVAAGINMAQSSLYMVDGENHFITKRFDRDGGNKLHTQTLAAMSPDAESYEQLISVCRKLHLPESDIEEVFRRMVFNVLSNNTDDHNKNFSFIMHPDGTWRLSPAYDMTYIFDIGGYMPNKDHCMYIRAKLSDVSKNDVACFARDNGIRHPDAIIRTVVNSLKKFRTIAVKNDVAEQWTGRIETAINAHLKEWELVEALCVSFELDGHSVCDAHIEQAYKGNFHLLANIDGTARKFVIGKNKEEYSVIESAGISNITSDQLKLWTWKYLLP